MGVADLAPFVRKKVPQAFRDVPLSFFAGRRLGIDTNNWFYAALYRAMQAGLDQVDLYKNDPSPARVKMELERSIVEFGSKFLRHGCTPVFVFDGTAPAEKTNTRAKRQKIRDQTKERADEVLARIRACPNRFAVAEADMKLARNLLSRMNILPSGALGDLRVLLELSGFAVQQSTTEGEKLTTMLVLDGLTAGSVSTDSDNWMLGCERTLKEVVGRTSDGVPIYSVVDLDQLLAGLGLSLSEFKHLCLLFGTDFNRNLPGIGPVKAYDLILKYRRIENIPLAELQKRSKKVTDLDCLNVETCERLIRREPAVDLQAPGATLDFDKGVFKRNREQLRKQYAGCEPTFVGLDFYEPSPIATEPLAALDTFKVTDKTAQI